MLCHQRAWRAPLCVRRPAESSRTDAENATPALRFGRMCAVGIVVAALVCLASSARGETVAPADTSPTAQQQAIQAIPLNQLTPQAQAKLQPVLSSPSIYRRLPAEVVTCDRDMYLTLVRNPEIIVSIWHLMEVTELDMRRNGPFSFNCDDKAGTTSRVELIYGDANTHVFYADTHYDGPLLARPVKGRVVLLLRSEYFTDEHGRPQVKSVMDAFIRIDHLAANLVARTLAPLVVRTADHNFSESFRFVGRVSAAAEANGPGMRELATRLAEVDVLRQRKFADVSTLVAQRAAARRELTAMPVEALRAADESPSTDASAAQSPSEDTAADAGGTTSAAESALAIPRRTIELRR